MGEVGYGPMMLRARFSRPDLRDPALAARWRTAAHDWDVPVFRTWDWVGCLASERYPDPVLAEVHDGAAPVALALFNRRRTRAGPVLHLHESGDTAFDAVFTEHNGIVADPAREAPAMVAILRAARAEGVRVSLPGVDDAMLAAARQAGGIVGPLQTRHAPFVRLDPPGFDYLMSLSRNTRAQLRRSNRAYERSGPIAIARAAMVPVALDWLDRMLALHIATWAARGTSSAFATAPVQRFARALVERGVANGAVDLLRITAGEREIGYLMNLRANGRICAYQSGFDYDGAPEHAKPGVTCHAASVLHAMAQGAIEYDFLAGDAQYKRSLANQARPLHWLSWQPALSIPGALALARILLRR